MKKGIIYKDIKIKVINKNYAQELSSLMSNTDPEYSKYFIPFNYDMDSIKSILAKAKLDLYFGVFVQNIIVGMFMLRGFDEGYKTPAYGVWIAQEYSGLGLSKLTLQYVMSLCKLNNIKRIMLKVHPENSVAKTIYESYGFFRNGEDLINNHLIYYKKI
ncbi:MAG: GNAT family N-acetyltransferase [Bacteroidales bacterium]|nr:GNAT family N-acetyltransferase [Bacteroidales bacterium]